MRTNGISLESQSCSVFSNLVVLQQLFLHTVDLARIFPTPVPISTQRSICVSSDLYVGLHKCPLLPLSAQARSWLHTGNRTFRSQNNQCHGLFIFPHWILVSWTIPKTSIDKINFEKAVKLFFTGIKFPKRKQASGQVVQPRDTSTGWGSILCKALGRLSALFLASGQVSPKPF